MKRASASIAELCDVQSGGTPSRTQQSYWGGSIPWVKISEMREGCVRDTEEKISEAGLANSSAKIFPKGTVLLSIFATIGRTAVLDIPAATNQAIAGLTIKNAGRLDGDYFRRYLDFISPELANQGRGVAQANINLSILKRTEVPLPPLAEQRRIAAILDKADAVRAKRREAIAKLDQLLQSVFLDMFGDPVRNSKGLEVVALGSLIDLRTGKLDANASSEDGEYPFFTCARKPLRISSYSYDCECVLVAGNGDLNVKKYSGKFDAYQRTYILESVDKNRLTTNYLFHFVDGYLDELRQQSIGGIIKYIKKGNLTEAMIPLPNPKAQIDFNRISDEVAIHRKRLEVSDIAAQRLFDAFQSKAFEGSL